MKYLKTMNKVYLLVISLCVLLVCNSCGNNREIDNKKNNEATDLECTVLTDNEESINHEEQANILVDWKHYEEQMSNDEKVDFREYLPVLEAEEKFNCFDLDNQKITFQNYLFELAVDDPQDIGEIVLIDLDNQNGKELIIHICEAGGQYLILTRDKDEIYGINMSAREFEMLQKDGKYIGSGGAGDFYFRRLTIDSSGMRENLIGECHGEEQEDGTYKEKLEIDGQLVTESVQDWMDENYGDFADWIE